MMVFVLMNSSVVSELRGMLALFACALKMSCYF